MVEPLRHRQTKGAETDMPGLPPPRHIPTLPRQHLWAGVRLWLQRGNPPHSPIAGVSAGQRGNQSFPPRRTGGDSNASASRQDEPSPHDLNSLRICNGSPWRDMDETTGERGGTAIGAGNYTEADTLSDWPARRNGETAAPAAPLRSQATLPQRATYLRR
jgi:hypothetical protein